MQSFWRLKFCFPLKKMDGANRDSALRQQIHSPSLFMMLAIVAATAASSNKSSYFRILGSCMTVAGPSSGMKCILPFNDWGVTYNTCTLVGSPSGNQWCSTNVHDNGTHIGGQVKKYT